MEGFNVTYLPVQQNGIIDLKVCCINVPIDHLYFRTNSLTEYYNIHNHYCMKFLITVFILHHVPKLPTPLQII